MSFNPRILALLVIVGIGVFLMFGGGLLFPNKNVKKVNLSATPTPVVITKYVTQLVTPTPDGHLYMASEYQNGTRLLQRPFSWIRDNVTGYKDMKVTTIVYDYKLFNRLHVFDPTEYKYDEALPSEGKQFCLIFVYVFMDDIIGDDTRMWSFNQNFFAVFDGNETYSPMVYPYQLRFKELEETFTFNNDVRVQAFKAFRAYSDIPNYAYNAGEYNDEIFYLRGGKSNAIDGFLIFEVDKNKQPEDLTVLAQFYSFGWSQWKLRI